MEAAPTTGTEGFAALRHARDPRQPEHLAIPEPDEGKGRVPLQQGGELGRGRRAGALRARAEARSSGGWIRSWRDGTRRPSEMLQRVVVAAMPSK